MYFIHLECVSLFIAKLNLSIQAKELINFQPFFSIYVEHLKVLSSFCIIINLLHMHIKGYIYCANCYSCLHLFCVTTLVRGHQSVSQNFEHTSIGKRTLLVRRIMHCLHISSFGRRVLDEYYLIIFFFHLFGDINTSDTNTTRYIDTWTCCSAASSA